MQVEMQMKLAVSKHSVDRMNVYEFDISAAAV